MAVGYTGVDVARVMVKRNEELDRAREV